MNIITPKHQYTINSCCNNAVAKGYLIKTGTNIYLRIVSRLFDDFGRHPKWGTNERISFTSCVR